MEDVIKYWDFIVVLIIIVARWFKMQASINMLKEKSNAELKQNRTECEAKLIHLKTDYDAKLESLFKHYDTVKEDLIKHMQRTEDRESAVANEIRAMSDKLTRVITLVETIMEK